jgi:hypothetical protein
VKQVFCMGYSRDFEFLSQERQQHIKYIHLDL